MKNVKYRGCTVHVGGGRQEFGEDAAKERDLVLCPLHTLDLCRTSYIVHLSSFSACFSQRGPSSIHMMEQLLDLSLLKVEERSSVLLGRCSSLLERRRTGLGLLAGWSLSMQA